jgi:hypothetical protein
MVIRVAGWVAWGARRSWRKLLIGCGMAGLVGAAFYWGHSSAQCQTAVPTPVPLTAHKPGELLPDAPLVPDAGSDYSRRAVARVYKDVFITREDLGEYLIARYGPDKVEALANRRIVDLACQAKGIHVTDVEVEAALAQDLQGLGVTTAEEFEKRLLKPRNTNLYIWKEDVLRPKLALAQYCRGRVQVTEADLKNAFEARFGPKVECRMILLPKGDGRHCFDVWAKVSKDAKAFDEEARKQYIPALAARAGEVPPITKHCGDEKIEKAAFSIEPGEVSPLIDTPDGSIILKCVRRIPPDTTRTLAKERATLEKEIYDQKIMQEIPKVLQELKAKADPKYFIRRPAERKTEDGSGMPTKVLPPQAAPAH